ncbi:hypothetical protein FIBSPDRAFT_868102 [Athelia psychrophila]|uniref:CFEM domain-containing protein n=1 Tax=Athelia psychrophila TaxID=1759441 RepID=A0A166DD65_9AGAM|nr:hypothetical protein FIBSPDRAFT_868102 [Fibularhizoctonia sp. CBS 109695]
MFPLDLLQTSWIVLLLLDSANGQRSLPRCASLCAMNEASHESCFISDISCLCRSTFNPNTFGNCLKHTCGEHDREVTQDVLAVLCGRRIVIPLAKREVLMLPPQTPPETVTLTLTSILPPAGNKTQSVTYIYTTVIKSTAIPSSSSATSVVVTSSTPTGATSTGTSASSSSAPASTSQALATYSVFYILLISTSLFIALTLAIEII